MSIADLRRQTERTETDLPVHIPAEERRVRIERLRLRLPGFDIVGSREPSNSLVDCICQMVETGQIKYVQWSACTSREQEILGIKKITIDSSIVTDSSGFLRQQTKQDEYTADVSTDLMLTHALTRRALAFELAKVCPYETFAALTTRFMKEYMKAPMTRYCKVSLEQIENADRHVFIELATVTAGGVCVRPDGSYPVVDAMRDIMASSEFAFLLMQMPRHSAAAASSGAETKALGKNKDRGTSRSRSRRRKLTETHEKNRVANIAAGRGKAVKQNLKGKGKGKGMQKGKGPFDPTTETGRTADGSPICFAYNTGGCALTLTANRCEKGFHVCWKIGCGAAHSSHAHR